MSLNIAIYDNCFTYENNCFFDDFINLHFILRISKYQFRVLLFLK